MARVRGRDRAAGVGSGGRAGARGGLFWRMPQKLSSRALVRLASLREFEQKTQRVYSLVEQYAAARAESEMLVSALKRALAQLKRDLLSAGFEQLSQLAGNMEMAAGRRTSQQAKSHILREGVGSLRFQLELDQRVTVSEDLAEQERRARAREEKERDNH